MKKLWASIAILCVLLGWVSTKAQTTFGSKRAIINSRHDFRTMSTATVKSASSDDPCIYCHTPHNGTPGPEVWNHQMGTMSFPTYGSSTMMSTVGTIEETDSSKLCLSCHDGTIALASTVNNGDIDFVQGPDYKLPATSSSNLVGAAGKGFTDDHPFAFIPNVQSNTEIRLPLQGDAVRLEGGKVQCVSCHDPHQENIDPVQLKFLVKPNQSSALCTTCHVKAGWLGSAHQSPPDPIQDQKYTSLVGAHTGYIGVANNACESCHRPHGGATPQRLLKFAEENTCYSCHDGNVTTLNVKADLTTKTYRHPVDITPSVHDAAEGPATSGLPMPETSASSPRHAECADCHNSHVAKPTVPDVQPFAPAVTNPLLGVKGYTSSRVYQTAANEYEICFKCHADSANRPQIQDVSLAGFGYGRNPQRQFNVGNPDAFNTRVEFTQGVSFHPVVRSNSLSSTTSLRPFMIQPSGANINSRPITASSQIYCSDCHASDTNRTLGTNPTGVTGPHGSNIEHLLERQSLLEAPASTPGDPGSSVPYALSNYGLCDKCHYVDTVIKNGVDSFPPHALHVALTSCSTCHDPHSSKAQHLINFDLSIVGPSKTIGRQVTYTPNGAGHGSCALTCHGHDHAPSLY